MSDLSRFIRDVPDFPKPGIIFKDISPLLKDHFSEVINAFVSLFKKEELDAVDYFAGIDARGFAFAGGLARALNKGMLMVRKKGKLPPPVMSASYNLEYGSASVEIAPGKGNVIVIDDVLATGGTLAATASLCETAGYTVKGLAVLVNLAFLNQFEWNGMKAKAIITYE